MQFDQLFGDAKAKSQTAMATSGRSVRLSESFEDVWEKFRFDALAGICNIQFEVGVDPLQQDRNCLELVRLL